MLNNNNKTTCTLFTPDPAEYSTQLDYSDTKRRVSTTTKNEELFKNETVKKTEESPEKLAISNNRRDCM